MELTKDTGKRLIQYLKDHGYPDNSIAVEYSIGEHYRVDIAILDSEKNIPVQIFEVKAQKSKQAIEQGKKQIELYLSYLRNKLTPAYLVFPKDNAPFFEVVDVSSSTKPNGDDTHIDDDGIRFNYTAQRNARVSEEAGIVKQQQDHVVDRFKTVCWTCALTLLVISVLAKVGMYVITSVDLAILGTILACILLPYASKLRILGFEFERLIKGQ